MNNDQIALLQFARARKKNGFTHKEYNFEHYSTASTARLSELRGLGFIFKESVAKDGTKTFWLIFEPKKYSRIKKISSLLAA